LTLDIGETDYSFRTGMDPYLDYILSLKYFANIL